MHWSGINTGIACFLMIGLFHPVVIIAEYYFTKKCWPVFVVCGAAVFYASVHCGNSVLSILLGVLGCSLFWSVVELFEQEGRILKGWFPANPKHLDYYFARSKAKGTDKELIFVKPGRK